MNRIEYVELEKIDPATLLPLLNKQKIREHLVNHPLFDTGKVKTWLEANIEMNTTRDVKYGPSLLTHSWLAGVEYNVGMGHAMAIVLDNSHWGMGKTIFRELMVWAKALGHKTVFIHFLYTRREYKHLRNISKDVYTTKLPGSKFTTCELTENSVAPHSII